MKRILFTVMVLTLALWDGCSKSVLSDKELSNKAIRMRSAVSVATSNRTLVVNGDAFTAQVCGWESGLEANMMENASWSSSAKIKASTAEESFELDPIRYYSLHGLTTTIRAWYPECGSPKNGKVSFVNAVGDVDVMLTQSVLGSNDSNVSEALLFEHLSTQLQILVVGHEWDPSEKIKNIAVKGVSLPNGIDIMVGKLQTAPAADFVINIDAPYLTPRVDAVVAWNALMIAPLTTNILYIDVETTAKSYKNIPVTTPDASFVAGRAYTVIFTCSGSKGIIAGSTIGEWAVGVSSGGVVD